MVPECLGVRYGRPCCSLKVSHGLDGTVKAVLVKDTPSSKGKPDKSTEPQQYIEVWRDAAAVHSVFGISGKGLSRLPDCWCTFTSWNGSVSRVH